MAAERTPLVGVNWADYVCQQIIKEAKSAQAQKPSLYGVEVLTRIAYEAVGMEPLPEAHSMEYLAAKSRPPESQATTAKATKETKAPRKEPVPKAPTQGASARRWMEDTSSSDEPPPLTAAQRATKEAREKQKRPGGDRLLVGM